MYAEDARKHVPAGSSVLILFASCSQIGCAQTRNAVTYNTVMKCLASRAILTLYGMLCFCLEHASLRPILVSCCTQNFLVIDSLLAPRRRASHPRSRID